MELSNYFSAKLISTGEWVNGDFVMLDGKPYIYGKGEIDKDTLRRNTGLSDRKGNAIREKDICRFYGTDGESTCVYEVRWSDNECCYNVYESNGTEDILDVFFAERCEVIGNVIDDPELLMETEYEE